MTGHEALAVLGATIILIVDALLVYRVLAAWRRTRKRPHLLIVLGIAASYVAVVGACVILAAEGRPTLRVGGLWPFARWTSFLGAALAYGMVGLFAADAFGHSPSARPIAVVAFVGLVAVAVGAVSLESEGVATPATTSWPWRVPFVALALVGSLSGFVRALGLVRAYEAARRRGRSVDAVALGRMRTMAWGFFSMALGQAPLLGFAPGGRFDDALGFFCVTFVMLGALGFTLACVATWATPDFLRARWAREQAGRP